MKINREEVLREVIQVFKEHPYLLKALREGKLELCVRTKPKLTIYFRRSFKRKLSWQHFFVMGLYESVKGLKGKADDLPISAYVVREAFKRLKPRDKEKLRITFNVKVPKYSYVSVNEKLLKTLKKLVRKYKVKQVLRY